MPLTSDPHAWLRPLWRRLHSDPAFARLAPESQFDALVREAREVSEKAAAQLAQCNPVTVRAMLGHLNATRDTDAAGSAITTLWRCTRKARVLECQALYLPHGIDLRLIEAGSELIRTELCRSAPEVRSVAAAWRGKLTSAGWTCIEHNPGKLG